ERAVQLDARRDQEDGEAGRGPRLRRDHRADGFEERLVESLDAVDAAPARAPAPRRDEDDEEPDVVPARRGALESRGQGGGGFTDRVAREHREEEHEDVEEEEDPLDLAVVRHGRVTGSTSKTRRGRASRRGFKRCPRRTSSNSGRVMELASRITLRLLVKSSS